MTDIVLKVGLNINKSNKTKHVECQAVILQKGYYFNDRGSFKRKV